MRNMSTAFGIGIVTGGRSLLGPALVAQWLARQPHPPWVDRAVRVLPLLSIGELVADKTALVQARTDATPLAGRLVLGAWSGAIVAPEGRVRGALLGALGAAAGAFGLFEARRLLTSRAGLPDRAVALGEDAALVAAGAWMLRRASRPRRLLRGG